MAHKWYYSKDDRQLGPVTPAELRELAESGRLSSTDLVRREDSERWRKASEVKGLFQSIEPPPVPTVEEQTGDQSAKTEPPPLPHGQPIVPSGQGNSVFDQAKYAARQIGAAAKSAALVTAKQAERTKILNVSLPTAYAALGKLVYAADSFRGEFPDLFADADELQAKIADLEGRAKLRPQSDNFTDKAKALGSAAIDKAEIQANRLRVSRLMAKLGQAAFETHGNESGPTEHVNRIKTLLARRLSLESEIRMVSKDVTASAQSGTWMEHVAIISAAILFCFPVGLFFVWKHPTWNNATKLRWTGVCGAFVILFATLCALEDRALRQRIVEAHTTWADGDREAAATVYRELTQDGPYSVPDSELPLVYGRLIDFELVQGHKDTVRRLLDEAKSYQGGFSPTISEETRRWIAQMEQDARREEAQRSAIAAEKKPTASDEMTALQTASGDEVISAYSLVSEYEGNEIAGDAKYKGNFIIVEGTVKEIGKTLGQEYVSLKAGTLDSVRCYVSYFDGSQTEKLAKLQRGDSVRVRGKCDGLAFLGVTMTKCAFLTPAETASGGKERMKLAAFRRLVAKYKQSPGDFATGAERQKYRDELAALQSEFLRIEFNPQEQQDEARAIIELNQSEVEGRYSGNLALELHNEISGMYLQMTQ